LRAQNDGQPFAYFVTNRAAMNAADRNIILMNGTGHDNFQTESLG